MRFGFIRDHRDAFPVGVMCETLGASRSGFHAWMGRPPSPSAVRRGRLVARIREAHEASRSVYGSPRVHRELKDRGAACCETTVAKLMRGHGIRSKTRRRFLATTDSRHGRPAAEDVLAREFHPDAPDAIWAADVADVPTAEGWLYLAVVLDLFSRRVVGWATADRLRAELPLEAVRMALAHRKPAGTVLHHSDRGSRYASEARRPLLESHGIEPSMSRAGDCRDNAVVESFFGTLKGELVDHERSTDREAARRSLFEYIEVFYNRGRRHSTLGYQSPAEFEARHQ